MSVVSASMLLQNTRQSFTGCVIVPCNTIIIVTAVLQLCSFSLKAHIFRLDEGSSLNELELVKNIP